MAKTSHGHTVGRNGKVRMTSDAKLPKGMRGVDPQWDVHTFTEGPLSRLFGRRR